MKTFKIEVFSDERTDPNVYDVLAPSEEVARVIAFLLDGGCESFMPTWDKGHYQLAALWTGVRPEGHMQEDTLRCNTCHALVSLVWEHGREISYCPMCGSRNFGA